MNDFNVKKYPVSDRRPIFIKASAGTGKTYTIEHLVKRLVDEANIPLEKILVVTYTEKAVGELKDRIRKILTESNARPDVDNAPIYTIHSFCQKTLEEFAFTAQKNLSLSLIDEDEIKSFIDRWIRDELKNDEKFITLYKSADNKTTFINDLKENFVAAVDKYYLGEDGEEDSSVVGLDEIYMETTETKNRKSQPYTYQQCHDLLTKAENDYESVKKEFISVFSGKDTNGFKEKFFKYQLSCFYRNNLPKLYLAWQNEKAKNKQQTFNDMIRGVREAVCKENSPLKKKLQEKYTYAIIDEFQDTNQKQWDIFKTVFMNDDETASDSEKHTLIVVGDPKQSIYSFQGADVNVYNKAVQEIEAENSDGAYELKENHRSSPGIIHACNALFTNKEITVAEDKTKKTETVSFFDEKAGINFTDSQEPRNPDDVKLNAVFLPEKDDDKKTAPLWIIGNKIVKNEDSNETEKLEPISSDDFAEMAVKKIIECCSFSEKEPEKTNLQIFDKEAWKKSDKKIKQLRNVSFSDFAVLARSSSEITKIEKVMNRYGVPCSRYKNATLFKGIECMHWITLLNAICASNFSGRNRKLLSEVLFTKFFGIPLEQVEDERFDEPTCKIRQNIVHFQQIAKKRQWAHLIEVIFQRTDLEKNLSGLSSLLSLSKFRQIGNYIAEYLYKNDCSLEDASKHISRLSQASEEAEDNGNLVARGTDFNCVQIMTIHASKGLEFPVVIGLGGFKDRLKKTAKVYLYHDDDDKHDDGDKAKLSFSDYGKNKKVEEDKFEWQRLFYVAYTRASSLMILPFYEDWFNPKKDILDFLGKNFDSFITNAENKRFYKLIEYKKTDDTQTDQNKQNGQTEQKEQKTKVQEILNRITNGLNSADEAAEDVNKQKIKAYVLAELVPELSLKSHSYTSLAHSNKGNTAEVADDGKRDEKEDSDYDGTEEPLSGDEPKKSLAHFDSSENPVKITYSGEPNKPLTKNYPKGSKVGNALHTIFEKLDFEAAGKTSASSELAQNPQVKALITESMKNESIFIEENDENCWLPQTADFVWNTLNATFPEITGSHQSQKTFALKEISVENHISEAEFNMTPEIGGAENQILKNYCKGFIDLIFRRKVKAGDGAENDVYSVLDWKSDSINFNADEISEGEGEIAEGGESVAKILKAHTDDKYSIQRVLYSYCLVKWLKNFPKYEKLSDKEIFQNHFGGIYYVYIRYCKKDTPQGIFARTWTSWEALEAAFNNICTELIVKETKQ